MSANERELSGVNVGSRAIVQEYGVSMNARASVDSERVIFVIFGNMITRKCEYMCELTVYQLFKFRDFRDFELNVNTIV